MEGGTTSRPRRRTDAIDVVCAAASKAERSDAYVSGKNSASVSLRGSSVNNIGEPGQRATPAVEDLCGLLGVGAIVLELAVHDPDLGLAAAGILKGDVHLRQQVGVELPVHADAP